jgi:hypothetical protein
MKTKPIIWISSLLILLLMVLVTVNFRAAAEPSQSYGSVTISKQVTPTTIPAGKSEIGSTNGIFFMGIVIALIAMVPVIVRNKRN